MNPGEPAAQGAQTRSPTGLERVRARLTGAVQGVGLRPAVMRAATAHCLAGWVANTHEGVILEAQGSTTLLEDFLRALRALEPPIRIEGLQLEQIALVDEHGFEIRRSIDGAHSANDALSPDLGMCRACLEEVREAGAQRFAYAFTSCAQCGPRYSIVSGLPFDRQRTTLSSFGLCDVCATQYATASDRRFHAQTIACPACGPELALSYPGRSHIGAPALTATAALDAAAELLASGGVVAALGIGGFQLLVDATDSRAVARLRARKQRPAKPLAVLFADRAQVLAVCEASTTELLALEGSARPIVLLLRRHGANPALAPCLEVAFESRTLGAMRAATPLHALLLERVGRPLVCTSGNLAEEPLSYDVEHADGAFEGIADAILLHDRKVLRPVDDSVVQSVGGELQVLRRARGYIPGRVAWLPTTRTILALGAHLKNGFALGIDGALQLGPYVGDLHGVRARQRQRQEVLAWLELTGAQPELIACDLHPGYASTLLANELSVALGAAQVRVQHHHAHVAAVLAEHDRKQATLGLAWDGAGYGADQTLWGGEALWCDGHRYQRVAHLLPFALPGGQSAQREPRRALLGALHAAGLWSHAASFTHFDARQLRLLEQTIERGLNAPLSSSMGRLFDVVAALLGVSQICAFEGQAADRLMQLAEGRGSEVGCYSYTISAEGALIDWRPMLHELVVERQRGTNAEVVARRFHETLVRLGVELAVRHSNGTVALAGGCFQNRLLLGRLLDELRSRGIVPLTSWTVPVNDGGLAVGQAWVAAHHAGTS